MLPATVMTGGTRFFPRGTDVSVLQWCSARGLSLDTLATKVGVPRINLSLMLKGVDPVTSTVETRLRDFINSHR